MTRLVLLLALAAALPAHAGKIDNGNWTHACGPRPAAASRWPAVVVPDEEEAEQGADDEEGDGGDRVDAAALAGH